MSEFELKGKKTLLSLSIICVVLDIISVLFSRFKLDIFSSASTYITNQALFRLLIYAVLIYFCYKGYLCAKWILSLTTISSGLILIFQSNILGSNFLLAIGSLSIVVGILLFISKSIKAFMSYQISN